MMYNRYIPGADGRYERHRVVPCPPPEPGQPPQEPCVGIPTGSCIHRSQSLLPEAGDLLVLLVLLLILTDGEETDSLSTLITLAAFLLLR